MRTTYVHINIENWLSGVSCLIHAIMLISSQAMQGRNLGSTFGGVCSYSARQIGRGLCIARRKVQYYTWLLGG